MKHSTLIKHAKKHLAKNKDEWLGSQNKHLYVCLAIQLAGFNKDQENKADDICQLIGARLGNHYGVVSDWLFSKVPAKDRGYLDNDAMMQQYRLRWMDSLIQEYKEVGK